MFSLSANVNVNITVNANVDVNVNVNTDGDDNVGWRLRCFHSRPIGHRKLHTPLTEDPQLLLMITNATLSKLLVNSDKKFSSIL